ncbi:MAG: hypothetical protein IKA32_12455 [Lentisphaeria bacterium]|nr:hypothetical protein [Lentisphaeria bacterium]
MACPTSNIASGAAQKMMEFFACPEFLKFFNIKPETVDKVLQSDFNCGFISALAVVVLLFVLLLVVRILLFFIFRTRRCSKVLVPSADGDLVVTRKAIESVVRAELANFAQITVRKLILYRSGKKYSLKLCCLFSSDGVGLPEITQELKKRIQEVMNKLFGIETMTGISICIERMKEDDTDGEEDSPEVVVTEPKNVDSGF